MYNETAWEDILNEAFMTDDEIDKVSFNFNEVVKDRAADFMFKAAASMNSLGRIGMTRCGANDSILAQWW